MTKACLGNKLESIRESFIVLFVSLNKSFRCSSDVNVLSLLSANCFLNLLAAIWIENHFPLKDPIIDFIQVTV